MTAETRIPKFIADHYRGLRFRASAYRRLLSGDYRSVRTFALFVGHPRSGHTLISALLDAHPEVLLGNEVDVIKHIRRGIRRAILYEQLIWSAEKFVKEGATWQGYSYAVPNQWQGRYSTLRVLGDKHAPATAVQLGSDPDLLAGLQTVIGVSTQIRLIHIVRNPFDNIATIWRRQSAWNMDQCAKDYFKRCDAVLTLQEAPSSPPMSHIRLEDFIADPVSMLDHLCKILDVEPSPDYLKDCASIVFASPRRSRDEVKWPDELKAMVHRKIEDYPFLAGYTYESGKA